MFCDVKYICDCIKRNKYYFSIKSICALFQITEASDKIPIYKFKTIELWLYIKGVVLNVSEENTSSKRVG